MISFSYNKEYLRRSLLFGLLALTAYLISSKGIFTDMHVVRNAFAQLSFIPFAYFVQSATRTNIFSKRYLPEFVIWAIWTIILPICMYLELNIAHDFIRFKGETLFGSASLLGMILLHVVAFDWLKKSWAYFLFGLAYVMLWLLPIAQLIYHLIYGEFISTGAIIALQQTNMKESIEWVMAYVQLPGLILLGLSFLAIGIAPTVYEVWYNKDSVTSVTLHLRKRYIGILAVIIWVATVTKLFPMVGLADLWREQRILQEEEQLFNINYEERFASIQVNPKVELSGGTFIIVIGESESRDYMKAYNPGYKYENTPWLSNMKDDRNMILFSHAYACYNQTKAALGCGFTEASQYSNITFTESMSLIDIAKKAGFKTYWFSNQLGEQFVEVPINMVARRADVVEISTNEYDDGLLPLLDKVNPKQNNLIIIHCAGSHARYACRFSESERVFPEHSNESDYANTVYFTDRFLQRVVNYAKEKLNLQAAVYYSDHGEDYNLGGHGPAVRKWKTIRIPMWIYLTPQYQKAYPEETANLYIHKDAYFTNDMIYNTICGLMGIPSNHYRAEEDLASKEYAFTKDSITAFNRQVRIADDNGQEDFEYLNGNNIEVRLVTSRRHGKNVASGG